MPRSYLYLAIAIIAEVIATTLLKKSDGFSRWLPACGSIAGYLVAFYCLSLSLRTINVGVAYAIWSGVGIVLISVLAAIFYHEKLDLPAIVGMGFVIAGILIMNFLSKTVGH